MPNCPKTGLPLGEQKPALDFSHLPKRYQVVIWRNWGLVTAARLARILKTAESNIIDSANALGLGEGASPERERIWLQRGYITLIRQNWHLLSYPQLLELIDFSAEQLEYTLREDDFLWNKLGGFKPSTEEVVWAPLSVDESAQTDVLRSLTADMVEDGDAQQKRSAPFEFLNSYGGAEPMPLPDNHESSFNLKYLYSYSAVYGDPLLDPELEPYPDGLLADLAASGVNGVWLQGVLYTLIPWCGENKYTAGHETRIANLNDLILKAKNHGIGVYLYLNEPRAMPPDFYNDIPDWRGFYRETHGQYAMCTSNPDVLASLKKGVGELFRQAPELAGVFTITMSENLTHCKSKSNAEYYCPRCVTKSPADIVASVNNTIAEGVHDVKPEAAVIAWSWAWDPNWAANAALKLREDIKLMCTSEGYLQTEAMGIRGRVGDYAMSKVGPGFLAEELWQVAKKRGIDRLAKVQMNNTWECSAVPYLPVPFLVKKHLKNLEKRGISELMAGWTLGGYPGGNLMLTEMEPEEMAQKKFGSVASDVVIAWGKFGEAFENFPLHGAPMLYTGPQNYGPMNLLFSEPSGYRATMVGFPYDDINKWRGLLFPPDVFDEQFRRLSEGWGKGVSILRSADPEVGEECRDAFDDLMRVAEAAYCHFRTTYLQMRFIRLRDGERGPDAVEAMKDILDEEIELARTLLGIVRRDSRIGFEASNHYYYTEMSLMEKVLNCEQVRRELEKA